MVERRMRRAIRRVGAYWYSAWKAAGSPELDDLMELPLDAPPQKWEKVIQIVDRENQDIGALEPASIRDYCCAKPASRPMGWPRISHMAAPRPQKPLPWWQDIWKSVNDWFAKS